MNQVNYKNIPCRYYLIGKCKRGDNSPFLHNINTNFSSHIQNKDNTCIFYLKNNCRVTDEGKCTYFHGYLNQFQSINLINLPINSGDIKGILDISSKNNEKYLLYTEKEYFALDYNSNFPNKTIDNNNTFQINDGFKISKIFYPCENMILIYSIKSLG